MSLLDKKYYKIILALSCIVLLYIIFMWINYLSINQYIIECFSSQPIQEDVTGGSTSHSVDLPLTTTYSCKNFCGPTARCSITGQQCFADIDCPGCQPYSPPLPRSKDCVPGDNDAGKLTWGVTPQYSPLTSGYGTFQAYVTDNIYSKPSQPNFGVNTWSASFNEGQKLFDARYKPVGLQYMPKYPEMYSLTGEFVEDGPLPSNATL
jgi:hypothetical protein